MHIGLVIYGSLDSLSGGYLYDRMLVRTLRAQGDRVTVASLPWRGYLRHLADNLDVHFQALLEDLACDVLIQDELNAPSLFALNARLRRRARYPLVAIVHHLRSSEPHPRPLLGLYRWVERRYLATLDGFIFNSQATRQAVAALRREPASEPPFTIALPAGDRWQTRVEAAEVRQRAAEPGPLRLLFVGNLIPRKGLPVLLDALRRLPPGLARLTVVGSSQPDPAYAAALRSQAVDLESSGQVRFCGAISDAELAAHLRTHQVLVVPSSYEGFGIVYLEGMGFGLPAIASSQGGAGEILTPGLEGFLVAPGDSVALAGRLESLARDRALLERMSLAALRRFDAHPTWEETSTRVRNFLLQIVSG